MIELLQHYSLSDIFMFTLFLALAVKSLVSFFDWAQDRFNKAFDEEYIQLNEKEELKKRIQRNDKTLKVLESNQEEMDKILKQLSNKIDMLIQSDKDDIKSYITREHHHFCYEVGWIDDFSLDCLEKRFKHYQDEGGNSFIEGFMEEIRELPRQVPENNKQS